MIETGTLLQNRYRLESRVGQGGMGAVFRARDERFGSRVAVKQTLFDDPTLRKAFEREAHLLNRLRHGALPKVSDHFTEGDGQFLVMEYIEGDDLGELLERRGAPFPAADVLRWGDELLDALEYLHAQEPPVIHRDIKPQNLKLTEPGRKVVLLDFGLAKGNFTQTRATSATGSVFGYSRNYAALEQIQGAGTDSRSDLYSLAATLYHLLTGVAPADALTRASAAVNNQPDPLVPAHRVRAGLPAQVGLALQRALALKAAARPSTAAEMRAALRQAAQSLPAEAAQPPHAPGSYAQPRQTSSELTLIETESTKAGAGKYQSAVVRETTQARGGVAASRWDVSEATVVDRVGGAARQPSFTYATSQTDEAQPAGRSRTKLLGLALAALVLLAAVGYALTQRSLAPLENAPAQTQSAPADSSDARTGATQPTSSGETQGTLPAAYDSTAQPRYDRSAQQDSAQPAQGNTAGAATAGTAAASGGGADELNSPSSDIGASSGGGLTIHRPAPSPLPNEDAEAERRVEESRPAPTAESQRRPPVEQRPAPPPPYGGHPPPPRHGGPPPPPGRRPPGH